MKRNFKMWKVVEFIFTRWRVELWIRMLLVLILSKRKIYFWFSLLLFYLLFIFSNCKNMESKIQYVFANFDIFQIFVQNYCTKYMEKNFDCLFKPSDIHLVLEKSRNKNGNMCMNHTWVTLSFKFHR